MLIPQECSNFSDGPNPAFYVDPKHEAVNSSSENGEFGFFSMSNSNIFMFVANIKPDDVLSGRGGATNSHSGNRAFRALVKRYQERYLRAKKRDKPNVASKIVDTIRSRGGRFLRRLSSRYNSRGEVLWIDIGNDRAREKTCQALREGAPKIRKKRKASFADECDIVKTLQERETFIPNLECIHLSTDAQKSTHLAVLRASEQNFSSVSNDPGCLHLEDDDGKDSSIMIRPSIELITDHAYAKAISVDQLEPHDRVLYLRDFLPPDPAIQRRAEIFLSYKYDHARFEGCDSYPCSSVEV